MRRILGMIQYFGLSTILSPLGLYKVFQWGQKQEENYPEYFWERMYQDSVSLGQEVTWMCQGSKSHGNGFLGFLCLIILPQSFLLITVSLYSFFPSLSNPLPLAMKTRKQ